MKDEYIWYLSDGTSLKGKAAKDYILNRRKRLDRITKEIEDLLNEMKRFNTSDTVIGDEQIDNDTSRLLETLENLSMMEIYCEELRRILKEALTND